LDSTLSRPIAAAAPPPPTAGGQLEPLDRLLPAPTPGIPGGWRRAVRAVTRGLVEPGAAAAVEYERQLVARVRIRRPEPRLVAFLAGKGGVGTTTVAAGVALILASLRADTTSLVSARSGAGSLGQRLLGQLAPPVPALVDGELPPPRWGPDRLAVVDGPPWHSPTPPGVLVTLLEQLRDQHPHTIVDIGNDLGEPAEAALARADQIVLVTSASQDAVAATRTALSRVHQIDPFRLATVVVAVTCLSEHQDRRTGRRLTTALGMQAARVVPIGFDPWLATGDRLDPARIRATTRSAYLRIAGMVVDPGRVEQWFSQPPGAGAGR
jgi:MinD-like ATPase involved in chromosome partitioning or flagellar assembly